MLRGAISVEGVQEPRGAMRVEEQLDLITSTLKELKGEALTTLDVRGKGSLFDYMVVVSGNSRRHVSALARNLLEKLSEEGIRPLGVEGERDQEWILIDLGEVVVHLMLPETREFYQLEKLWGADFEESWERAGP